MRACCASQHRDGRDPRACSADLTLDGVGQAASEAEDAGVNGEVGGARAPPRQEARAALVLRQGHRGALCPERALDVALALGQAVLDLSHLLPTADARDAADVRGAVGDGLLQHLLELVVGGRRRYMQHVRIGLLHPTHCCLVPRAGCAPPPMDLPPHRVHRAKAPRRLIAARLARFAAEALAGVEEPRAPQFWLERVLLEVVPMALPEKKIRARSA